MSGFDEAYAAVREGVAATPGKRVLLVEGTGDVDFLTSLLDKPPLRARNAHARWAFGAAGGKESVIRMLERQPDWFGLVDRDAWDERQIREATRKLPNLMPLPRYCVENYFIEPAALESLADFAATDAARRQIRKRVQAMREQVPQAIRHASLWRAVQPLQEALQALGFNGLLLRFQAPGDEQVREVLRGWSNLLDAERVFAVYQTYQAKAEAMSPQEALRLWVHGKVFWRHVAAPMLLEALGEPNEGSLRRSLLRSMPLPQDMQALLEGLLGTCE